MNLAGLQNIVDDGGTPLLRTDFSDDDAWDRLATALDAPHDVGDGEEYTAYLAKFDGREWDGMDAAALARVWDRTHLGYVLLADARSMREVAEGGDPTVVWVDLSLTPEEEEELGEAFGRSFRCAIGEVALVEANLSLANMDFDDFSDSVGPDGVYRGFDM